jgi:DNA-binding transcriptional MerR regulator
VTTRDDTDDQSFFEEDIVGSAAREEDDGARGRTGVKSSSAFRTISEVSAELDVPQHVLRFWESKFTQLRPLKRGGGRRYYRPEDLALLRRIHELLYKDGYTIKGVQRVLRAPRKASAQEETVPQPAEPMTPVPTEPKLLSRSVEQVLRELLKDLKSLRAMLD